MFPAMLKVRPNRTIFWLVLLLPILYFPIFGHLSDMPLDSWDEARLAVNAYEMHQSGDWFVTSYDHKPDMWNTKPPLMIWLQVLCIKLFGASEFAIRFPSALAALGTCLLLFWFFAKKSRHPALALLTCLVLVSSEGYVRRHGIRSGDYDSLLTFFTTSFLLFWFLYIEEGGLKYFYLFIGALILASLTKSIQPLIFLPGVLIYTIYRRRLFGISRSPHLYIGIVLFLMFIPGYYLLREQHNHGYIAAVFANELGGRFGRVLENHSGGIWFYIGILERYDFYFWFVLVPIGLIIALGATIDDFITRIAIWAGIAAATYLAIISLAATKLSWYNIPVIPLLSIIAAISLHKIFLLIKISSPKLTAAIYLFAVAIFLLIPYRKVFEVGAGLHLYTDMWENRKAAEYFQEVLKGTEDIKGYCVVHTSLEQNHNWYLKLLADKKGVKFCKADNLHQGCHVLTFQREIEKYLQTNYQLEFLDSFHSVKKYYVKGRNSNMNYAEAN